MRFLVVFLACPLLACTAAFPSQAQSVSLPSQSSLPDAPDAHLATAETSETLLASNADLYAPAWAAASPVAADNLAELHSPESGPAGFSAGFSSAEFSSSSLIAAFQSGGASPDTKPASQAQNTPAPPADEEQPKRILGLMPNYRAVSAGVRPPPPGAKESFIIATENNFDYSQYVFVGLTSLMAEGTNTHPEFGKGARGYWSYYWRGYIDKSAGDYLIIFAFPTLFHEDERYFAMGQGSFWKHAEYSGMSVFITPDYHGKNTFNWAEILGRGVSQAVSLTYYPSSVATPSSYFSKFGYAVGRDALTNVFREFYPDIARTVFKPFHRKAAQQKTPKSS